MSGMPYAPIPMSLIDILGETQRHNQNYLQMSHLGSQLNALNQASALQNAIIQSAQAQMGIQSAPRPNAWYHKQRAEEFARDGDKLIDRIAFWGAMRSVIGPLSDRIVGKLAERLEALTDKIERELEWAGTKPEPDALSACK